MTMSRRLLLVSLALACMAQMVACERGQIEEGSSRAEPSDSPSGAQADAKKIQLKQSGLLPAFLWPMRASKQPNVFLIFYDLYEPMMPQQIKDMVNNQIRPPTDQMSEQILQNVPGAKQMYEQMNSFLQMFSQFGPQNFLPGGGGGGRGGGPLGDLMGGLIGRRR